ncbi:MAG: hypothetical protein ACR2QW_19310 [bacterium]
MNSITIGILWTLVFVVIEAIQFVYFGALFQDISSFLFGFFVFGIIAIIFISGSAIRNPDQLSIALRNPAPLIKLNIFATLAWAAYLTSVQLLEPAVVYTISAGAMPVTAYLASRLNPGHGSQNRFERYGLLILIFAILYLTVVTVSGNSGFVSGGKGVGVMGVLLAIADGVFFTWMLIYSQKLDSIGVGPGTVFGLRFPLYVVAAGGLSMYGLDARPPIPNDTLIIIILMGLLLTVPHLYALQRAVSKISTPMISALTTLGPFIIFSLQIIEGRVQYSNATLAGIFIYCLGSFVSVAGVVKSSKQTA